MLAFTSFYKAQGPKKREILRVIATSEGQFYIKRRLWKIIKLHSRSHLSLPRLLHWTDFKTSLEKSRKTWNIPAEQTLFSLPHFHFCRADLSSIVTWVLWDFVGWRRRGSHGSAVHAVPRFSVTNLRVLIRNASQQSLVFTFGSQPHRKLSHRRRIPSRRRSYQTCKAKIIHFTKQHRFSRREIHYVVLTFASKFKNLHSILTYCDPPAPPHLDWLWVDELKRKCSKLNPISAHHSLVKHQPTRQITSWTSKLTCVFMWTLSYCVWSTIFNSTGGRKAVSSSGVCLLTPKMENITTRGD